MCGTDRENPLRSMTMPRRRPPALDPVQRVIERIDRTAAEGTAPDAVASGFPSLDRVLAGGFRREDLVLLAGDVGSGKSSLALAMAVRAARAGTPVLYLSGEMGEERLTERAVALDARATVDDMRAGRLSDETRAAVGAAALALRGAPLTFRALGSQDFTEVEDAVSMVPAPQLVVVDALAHVMAPRPATRSHDRVALAARALKSLALQRHVTVLALTDLPALDPRRPDPRPVLDDLPGRGALKQEADVVLGLYREEMYRPDSGVEGAAELFVRKNRNGPTGFVDLYFHAKWLRFEDLLDPEP
jgi:replicative DNA helicase